MATRINRKNAAVGSPKEVVTAEKTNVRNEPSDGLATAKPAARTPIGRRIAKKNQSKRVNKTSVAVKLKAKAKKFPLNKSLLKNAKTVDGKKRILNKNVVKEGKPRKRKIQKEVDDSPPVLEPIFPIEENTESKKQTRARATKKTGDSLDVSRSKVDNEDNVSLSSDVTDISNSDIPTLTKQVRKPRASKKPKLEIETLEDVMNDLSFLIKTEEAKEEGESLSESGKTESISKPKKLTKRQRIELLKKKIIKKENIENTLSKLDAADEKVIDMLDLNVKRVKQKPLTKRRHSIEKFPVGTSEESDVAQAPFLGNFPGSISPKTRRITKPRRSVDGASRKSSPYTTRSESPGRILRNGKQRKAKGHLLEGLEAEVKKRRRLCSDLSGSEISVSKFSGYDSDSSFSDLSSLHGAESNESEAPKTKEETSIKPTSSTTDTANAGPINDFEIIDTNSNLCEVAEQLEDPCVPDNDTLLDIMKLAFNEVNCKKSVKSNQKIATLVTSKFYGKPTRSKAADKAETVVQDSTTETVNPETVSELPNPVIDIPQPEPVQNVLQTESINGQDQDTIPDKKIEAESIIAETPADPPSEVINNYSKISETTWEPIDRPSHVADMEECDEPLQKDNVTEDTLGKYEVTDVPLEKCVEANDSISKHVEPESISRETEAACKSSEAVNNESDVVNNQSEVVNTQTEAVNNQSEAVNEQSETVITISKSCAVSNGMHDVEKMEMTDIQPMEVNDVRVDTENHKVECDLNIDFAEKATEPVMQRIDSQPDIENPEDKPIDVNENSSEHNEILSQIDQRDSIVGKKNNIEKSITETDQMLDPAAVVATVTDAVHDAVSETVSEAVSESTTDTVVASGSEEIDVENISNVNTTEKCNAVMENSEENVSVNVKESAEELAVKESILKALGLQSLKAAEEAKQKTTKEKPSSWKSDNYTGTLKTVIKINRDKKKGGKSSIKMTLQKSKPKTVVAEEEQNVDDHKANKDGSSSTLKQGGHSSDTAGAHRKSHYSNRSNLDGSSEHTSDGETAAQDGAIKALVIPEKASSFSIHPGRLCKDECSYCFGKFGLFDTPCHIAQMKSVERQNKILATEKHLTRDSCLCDACYRHVDRKSNTPSYTNRSFKRNSLVAPGPRQNHCHVLGCNEVASNILRRKWIIKMRKSICQVINIDLDNPGLHSIPICEAHYAALEHLMVCAMCKRRLARNHVHYLGPEVGELNAALAGAGVALALADRPVVCKLCKCFAAVALQPEAERQESAGNFFAEYRKRLLHFNHIVPMDAAAAEEPIAVPTRADGPQRRKRKSAKSDSEGPESRGDDRPDDSRPASPVDEFRGVDYAALIPAIAMDCGSDGESRGGPPAAGGLDAFGSQIEAIRDSVEITKISKHSKSKNGDVAVHKLGSNSSISVRQLFPGEEDVPLSALIDFNNVKEITPEGWERCSTTIQYDSETKRLWQELQKPYGNQSSFLRHLILLEKYFRNGDLVLSPRAGHHAINYSESVNNRLRAYDNIPSGVGNVQPLSMLPFNKMQKSSSGIITSAQVLGSVANSAASAAPSPPVTSVSLTATGKPIGNLAMSVTTVPSHAYRAGPLLPNPAYLKGGSSGPAPFAAVRPKAAATAPPPGLISLHPGTARPVAPPPAAAAAGRAPQSQKIKFPITKNWRPNLIPIDPSKKQEKKVGLVQVISGGKPYHITLEDYKKMCAIKRSFEMKQKRLQEAQSAKPILVTHNSVLKSIIPRKGLIISKTATVKTEATSPPPPATVEDSILEKLDRQVERLESKLNDKSGPSLLLPRIPRSLTVIPQTVTRKSVPSRPSSPVLLVTSKSNGNSS